MSYAIVWALSNSGRCELTMSYYTEQTEVRGPAVFKEQKCMATEEFFFSWATNVTPPRPYLLTCNCQCDSIQRWNYLEAIRP